MAPSDAGDWRAASHPDGGLKLWRLGTDGLEAHVRFAAEVQSALTAVAFHPKIHRMAIGLSDGSVGLMDFDIGAGASGEGNPRPATWRKSGVVGTARSVAFSADSSILAVGGDLGPILLCDLQADAELPERPRRVLDGHSGGTRTLAFHHDQLTLATAA